MNDEARPGARWWVPEDPTAWSLKTEVQHCRGCELYENATQAVMGEGPEDADLLLVGEQPGDREDLEGHPFVGPAGRLLDQALVDAGADPSRVYRTNVVKHFRFSGTRGKQRIHKSPSRVHVAACGPWLLAEIDLVRPTGVVLLGATAGKAVLGPKLTIGEARGRLRAWPEDSVLGQTEHPPDWVMVTAHPSSVLRSRNRDQDHDLFVTDLRTAVNAVD